MSLAGIAATINSFMNAGPGLVWGMVCIGVVGLPLTFLHELGHALIARARLGSDVRVTVGSAGRIATLRMGRLPATVNAFHLPGRVGGMATFDARRATARDMLWIALAGPAASLTGGIVVDIAYRHAPPTGVVHDLLWAAVLGSRVRGPQPRSVATAGAPRRTRVQHRRHARLVCCGVDALRSFPPSGVNSESCAGGHDRATAPR